MNPQEVLETQRMMQVVRQMKEIPELPSEAPKDIEMLQAVEFPDAGGVLTYMAGKPYPYKGFPFFDFVDKVDLIKKISRSILSGLYHQFKAKRFLLITLLPAFWALKPIVRTYFYVIYRLVDRVKIKRDRYCDAIREIYRAFSPENNDEFHLIFRDMLCMVLEMDNAYRYRFQDIIVNLDKDALQKNPRKELLRLIRILSDRERTEDIKDTWVLVRLAVSVYLFVDRDFKKILVSSLLNIDLDKVKLSIEDKLFASGRKDYIFAFMLYDNLGNDPEGHYCIKYNDARESWIDEKQKIQEESTKEHQELFEKHSAEQKKIATVVSDERMDQIQKDVSAKAQEIYRQRDLEINEIISRSKEQEKKVGEYLLTEEQNELARVHNERVVEMNAHFENKLKSAEEKYKVQCEELKKLLPKTEALSK